MRAHELDEGLVVNILKSAIATCDRVLTVSQGYAFEITTPEGGKGMEGLLQSRTNRLDGIANGHRHGRVEPGGGRRLRGAVFRG